MSTVDNRIRPTLKTIIGGCGAVLMIVYLVNLIVQEKNNKNAFYSQGFSTTVVSSNLYQGRSMEFHLQNGLKVYFMPPVEDRIMVGDSIQKKPNTYLYIVYRKNANSNYDSLATYDFTLFY